MFVVLLQLWSNLFKLKYKKCFISWCWSQTLSIILGGFTLLNLSKTNKIKFVPVILHTTLPLHLNKRLIRARSLEAPRSDIYVALTWTHSALKPPGAKNCFKHILKKSSKSKWWLYFCFSTAIVMFTVAILQRAAVKLSNITAHEKGFNFHAQQYSCLKSLNTIFCF